MSPTTQRPNPATELQQLPNLAVILDQIERQLVERLEIGILSGTVIRRREQDPADGWEDYEKTLREISVFLGKFSNNRLRRSDILLEPILAGNTFMVLPARLATRSAEAATSQRAAVPALTDQPVRRTTCTGKRLRRSPQLEAATRVAFCQEAASKTRTAISTTKVRPNVSMQPPGQARRFSSRNVRRAGFSRGTMAIRDRF